MQKFDVIIVGSGLAGLTCGYILSKEGYNVCVMEKEDRLGGCIQTFKRDGTIFDVGGHYVGGLDKGQNLYQLFKYLEILDKIKVKKLDEDGFDHIKFYDGKEYKYAMGSENFIETLAQDFPLERQALNAYIKKIKDVCKSFNLYNLKEINTPIIESMFFEDGTYNYIKSITKNTRLQNVLAGTNSLYAGVSNQSPLYMHALITNSYIESSWRFIDGSSQIADLLAENIKNNGGTVLLNTKVNKFISESNQIKYVDFNANERIEAEYFISNINPALTLDMLDFEKVKKSFYNRVNSLEQTIGMYTMYITFKDKAFRYINHNIYHYSRNNVWTAENYNPKTFPDHSMIITPANSSSDEWATNMVVMTYMPFDEVKKWENTYIENRGAGYLEFKEQKAQLIFRKLEELYPGISGCVKNYYTSTPLTYRDYTGTIDGSLYGISRDYNHPMKSVIFPRTYIPNLYLTGQNVNLHGVLGVTISAVLTCAEFVGLNPLIKKIRDAQ